MNLRKSILIILSVGILSSGGIFIYNDINSTADNVKKSSSKLVDTSPKNTDLKGGIVKEISLEKANKKNISEKITAPNLDDTISFSKEVSEEIRKIIANKIDDKRNELKINPKDFDGWIDLGILYKVIGDYDKTIKAWEYAGLLRPTSGLPFRDLGDLYGYYLKEPKKAEENLLKAIKNTPNQVEYYTKTADFYRDVLNNIEKMRNIVEKGLKANPGSVELKKRLNSL